MLIWPQYIIKRSIQQFMVLKQHFAYSLHDAIGQHMYVDITDCVKLNFNIGTGSSTTTRTWSLKTTQIECGNRLAGDRITFLLYFLK